MGGLNFLGMGGGTAKPIGGKPPSFGKFGFTKHAHKTRVSGGKVGFFNKVKWDKMMQNSGRSTFKTRSGDVVKARATKKIVAEMIEKAGGRGLSGKQIKQKLVRDHGMKYKDAGDIARAATYHYYEPPPEGKTPAQIAARISQVKTSYELGAGKEGSVAGELKNKRTERQEDRKAGGGAQAGKTAYKEHLGIEGDEHSTYAGGEKMKTGLSERETKSGEEKPVGQSEEPVGVGGSHGKQAMPKEETAAPYRKTQQTVPLSGGGGGIANPPSNIIGISGGPERHELSGEISPGGLVRSEGVKGDIIRQLSDEREAALAAAENDKEEGDELPSEEETDETANVDEEESE